MMTEMKKHVPENRDQKEKKQQKTLIGCVTAGFSVEKSNVPLTICRLS